MTAFSVTFERFNDREAEQGGTDRYGFLDCGLTLHEAVRAVRDATPAASERVAVYPSDSDPRGARWMSAEHWEFETGDAVTLAVHFPASTTPASRARLVKALSRWL